MNERGINGVQLTSSLGIDKSSLSHWSSGKAKPSTDAIIKLAEYFGVTTDWLLTGREANQKEFTDQEVKLINDFRSLNHEGKNKSADYINDLLSSGKYINNDMPNVNDGSTIKLIAKGGDEKQIRLTADEAKTFKENLDKLKAKNTK